MGEKLLQALDCNSQRDIDGLWARYKASGDIELRNKLVVQYINLVEIVCKKMYRVFREKVQLDDIISNGMIVLIKSIESFEPHRGVKFDSYASIRIRGSVIDYIRSQDWVPRGQREKSKKIQDAYSSLKESLEREPTYEEIGDLLNMKKKEVENVLSELHTYNVLSFEDMLNDKMISTEVEDTKTPSAQSLMLKKEFSKILAGAIDKLSEKEKLVVTLIYYEELKLKDIARILEISSSRVCQLHSMALIKLKSNMVGYVKM